ncbi:hypothetical protein XENOCAPTIV_026518 [Xenoophorus captivus]|uniref:Ankyrin repeat domain-containing protein 11 n=1 Tax=Xenoophorus captivus TaxID=1517983 RepID=A0ABV0QWP6_9TELE
MGMPGIRAGYPVSERQQVALLMQMTAAKTVNSPGAYLSFRPRLLWTGGGKENGDWMDLYIHCFLSLGWTALHEACNRGYYDVAKQLLAAGAEVNTKGLDDDTPLHDASNNGHFKVVKLLLRYGADPRQSNRRGETPLKVASSPTMLNLLLGKGTYTSSEESSSEEEDAPSFAPSSSVDGNNTDSEFEKGLKLKGKATDPPKSAVTPVKDEYEFDEDDEEERVPPVDDKHLLKKDFRKDSVSKTNSFISIPKMEVKTYSKSNSLTPKKTVRRIISDSNSSDEDDRTLCFTPAPTPRQQVQQTNTKTRDSGSKQQKDKNKVKKKRKKESKNNVSKEVRFGKVNDKFCTSDSDCGDLESEDDKGSNSIKDSATMNLKESPGFNASSSSHGNLNSQKQAPSLAEQHPKQWRTDGWKTVSSPTWSDVSSLSDPVSESEYSDSKQTKDKKEKSSQDKHADREKDFMEVKKEERKPEKIREKTWYKIADIFTDESDDDEDSYNGTVIVGSGSIRKDSTPDQDELDHFHSEKMRKSSADTKHNTEKAKDKDHKEKKKDKASFDSGKERKGSLEKHNKDKKDSVDGKYKERKDRISVDSNQDKKNKQKLLDKRDVSEEKTKSKYKDKQDHLKERKPSKGSGENEKSLLEKLEEEAMNDYKDDSNDKNSDISSDSFTDRGHEPVLSSYYDSLNLTDISEDRRDSLSIATPQDRFRDKERHRHSSSSSSKKSHDKEKEKVKKDKGDKRDKTGENRESYSRRESLPFEKEPMPLEADPYTFPFGGKGDGDDDFDKTLEFEKEMSKKDKEKSTGIIGDRMKDKKKKEKHKDKVKEEKNKYMDGFGSFKHREDVKSGLKDSPQLTVLKDRSKEQSPKFDLKKDRTRDMLDKDNRMDHSKSKAKDENEKLSQSKDQVRKDIRPREKLLVDDDYQMTSFGQMLSLKDQEVRACIKKQKEKMKQMERLRPKTGDPKLKDKAKSTEEVKKNRSELSTKKLNSLESGLKEKKLKDVGLPAQIMSPGRKFQPTDSQSSKDWMTGHQMKENLPASPRPDQNRPTGVPTPTSVISCPSFEEVMQTPRTPSCSPEDYPDIMLDGLDCQNSSAMTMSMNACSPTFFER